MRSSHGGPTAIDRGLRGMFRTPKTLTSHLLIATAMSVGIGFAAPLASALAAERMTISRDVSGFDTIRLSGQFNGTVVVGKTEGLTLTGGGDLEKRFVAEVRGDELRIKLTRNRHRGDTITIAVNAKELEEFIIEGAGKFDIKGIDSEEFSVKLPGAASITMAGKCGELNISIAGAATVKAEDLICQHGHVKISGTGTISLHASESIDARVSGLGKIEVYGHPEEIDQHISGLGRIKLK